MLSISLQRKEGMLTDLKMEKQMRNYYQALLPKEYFKEGTKPHFLQ